MKPLFTLMILGILLSDRMVPAARIDAILFQSAGVPAPVLKWKYKGCTVSRCEPAWYASPAVADLDGNGSQEVISAGYTIFVLAGSSGDVLWQMPAGFDRSQPGAISVGRSWSSAVVTDIDADGKPEIVTAHAGGYVSVYENNGYFKPGWPQRPVTEEIYALAAGNIDSDPQMEIVVGRALLNAVNTWVFEWDGTVRSGWPQLTTGIGGSAGIYNDNIAIGSFGSPPQTVILVPSDAKSVAAYTPAGSQFPINPMYQNHPDNDMRVWSQVPAYFNLTDELRGWGPCSEQDTYRSNFARSPVNIMDVNGDGHNEVIAMGNVENCHLVPEAEAFYTPFLFNADRSRFMGSGYDWSTPPFYTSTPTMQDETVIAQVMPNPVSADLDGDGLLETLFASFDGQLHAVWLDRTEHGQWPFRVYQPTDGYWSFASEPVVADLDNDGQAEVIFTSWTQKGSGAFGKLFVVDSQGRMLYAMALPAPPGSRTWGGAMAAPTLADLDGDGNLDVVLNTVYSGLVAYSLPGSSGARVLWGTGRGNFRRSGTAIWFSHHSYLPAIRR